MKFLIFILILGSPKSRMIYQIYSLHPHTSSVLEIFISFPFCFLRIRRWKCKLHLKAVFWTNIWENETRNEFLWIELQNLDFLVLMLTCNMFWRDGYCFLHLLTRNLLQIWVRHKICVFRATPKQNTLYQFWKGVIHAADIL